MEPVLVTRHLTFSYGTTAAVSNVDLTLDRGDIFGFVGPNGAGKTTTIKLLLGLLTPSSGTIEAFGRPMRNDRTGALRRIGALVETPSLYGHLTAEENLRIQRLAHGFPARRIAEVLELVALQRARSKKVKHFSLGMKQRLGVAMALVHEPELLILDEPANGLDPAGIQDLRLLLKRLATERHLTVFLSSHILAELEQTATKIAVISRGVLRYQGTLDALKASRAGHLKVTVDRVDRARQILERDGYPLVHEDGDTLTTCANDREVSAAVTAALVSAGVKVYQVAFEQPNLEDIFLAIVRAHDGSNGL
jgi:ABC-2 type transport system ATP-binding protein